MPAGGTATGHKIHRGALPTPTSRAGIVTVYPPATAGGVGLVFAPDGTEVSTSGTQTSGLQEALNYAAAHTCDVNIIGGGDFTQASLGGAVVYNIQANTTLEFPALQGRSIRSGAITINIAGSDATPGIRFDSMMMADIDLRATQVVVSSRTGHAVVFEPRNNVPIDGFPVIIDSAIRLHTIACAVNAAGQIACQFKATTASIIGNRFEFIELNGGDSQILVTTPTGALRFANNYTSCEHLHGVNGANPHVLIGQAAGVNTGIAQNEWRLHILPDASNKRGFDTRETGGRGVLICYGVHATKEDVFFEAEAAKNLFILSTDKAAGAVDVADASTAKTNRVLAQQAPVSAAITVGASPYTYPDNATVYARDEEVVISGGTVSAIAIGDGTTMTTTGMTAGVFHKPAGIFLKVTYTGVPTMTRWVGP